MKKFMLMSMMLVMAFVMVASPVLSAPAFAGNVPQVTEMVDVSTLSAETKTALMNALKASTATLDAGTTLAKTGTEALKTMAATDVVTNTVAATKVLVTDTKDVLASTTETIKTVAGESTVVVKYMADFARGLQEVCNVLAIEINEFIKTPVGMITAGIAIYYVLDGSDTMTKVGKLLLCMPFVLIGWKQYFGIGRKVFFGYTEKVRITDDNGKAVKPKAYEFVTHESKWKNLSGDACGGVVIAYIVATIVMVIFTGSVLF